MNYARRPGIDSVALRSLAAREDETYLSTHRESARLAEASAAHWLNGVPMHWMRDWNTPHPLFVKRARGVEVEDVDGNSYVDFCFGDTGAMFGHSPPAIARALTAAGADGITAMLPAARAPRVGEKLANLFGLPFWQMTQTATDANRVALRWARAITARASWHSMAVITAPSKRPWCVRFPTCRTGPAHARAPGSSAWVTMSAP